MTDTRSIFYAVPAFVGALTGDTKCSFWALYPTTIGWDPAQLIAIDLALSPQAVRAGQILPAAIQVDDNAVADSDPGLTTIGPRWPDGHIQGAAWLESTFYGKLGANQPPRVPAAPPLTMWCRDYELTSVLYWDGVMAGRRFYGFHAEIVGTQNNLTQVTIWEAGKSLVPNIQPVGTYWIDLAKSTDPSMTTIGPAQKAGALYLDRPTTMLLALHGPKTPPFLGGEAF